MALELVNEYEDEVIGLSADAKAKLNLSGAAVSRMVRARSFMLTSDRISLSDHDFPEPGYKLTPMGYMRLIPKQQQQRSRSTSPVRSTKKHSPRFADDSNIVHNRKSTTPRTGPLTFPSEPDVR